MGVKGPQRARPRVMLPASRACVAELERFGIEISAFDRERLEDLLDDDPEPGAR